MSSGRLIIPIIEPLLTAAGLVASGGTLTVKNAGTATLSSLYADAALGTPIANPQTSDSAGRFYSQTDTIWADSALAYDATVDWPDGSTETYANLYVLGAATNVSGYAPINSPTFTGVPQAPTPATNDSSAKIATTAYVQAQGFAPLAGPTFTGVPAGPTAAVGTSTTQLATTAFVQTSKSAANLAASFVQSLGASGYITLPGGLILQWNTVAPGDDSYVVYNLPLAFTTTFYGCVASVKYNAAKTGGNGGGAFCYPVSLTQIGVGIAWDGDSTGITNATYFAWGK